MEFKEILSEIKIRPWLIPVSKIVEEATTKDFINFWKQKSSEKKALFNYRFEHTRAVIALSITLSKNTGADMDIVLASALLHDIAKKMSVGRKKGINHGEGHAEKGAIMARTILSSAKLKKAGFPQEKISAVCNAISSHAGLSLSRPITKLESAILWDADKLSKLGATFITHSLPTMPVYTSRIHGENINTEKILQRGEEWVKLGEKIVKSLNTSRARKMGRSRLMFLNKFYKELAGEWTGKI